MQGAHALSPTYPARGGSAVLFAERPTSAAEESRKRGSSSPAPAGGRPGRHARAPPDARAVTAASYLAGAPRGPEGGVEGRAGEVDPGGLEAAAAAAGKGGPGGGSLSASSGAPGGRREGGSGFSVRSAAAAAAPARPPACLTGGDSGSGAPPTPFFPRGGRRG